ncbi:hypothetical protein ACFXKD_05810 [Nocardiopsis aegyptia]
MRPTTSGACLGPLSPRLVPLSGEHAEFDVDASDDLTRARSALGEDPG